MNIGRNNLAEWVSGVGAKKGMYIYCLDYSKKSFFIAPAQFFFTI